MEMMETNALRKRRNDIIHTLTKNDTTYDLDHARSMNYEALTQSISPALHEV